MPKKYRKLPALTSQDVNHFWKKVDKTPGLGPKGDCWQWTAASRKRGYGSVTLRGQSYISHRVAYFIQTDIDPFPFNVCHKCDWPPCVRGSHFFLGTDQDNATDRNRKGRAACGTASAPKNPARGRLNGNAKLGDDERCAIIKLFASGKFSKRKLGRMFYIDPGCITQILNSPYWVSRSETSLTTAYSAERLAPP